MKSRFGGQTWKIYLENKIVLSRKSLRKYKINILLQDFPLSVKGVTVCFCHVQPKINLEVLLINMRAELNK